MRISVRPKDRLFGGDEDVGVGRESGPARQRRTVDAGDDRLPQTESGGEKALVEVVQLRAVGLQDFGQVHAGAKRFAAAGKQNRSDAPDRHQPVPSAQPVRGIKRGSERCASPAG